MSPIVFDLGLSIIFGSGAEHPLDLLAEVHIGRKKELGTGYSRFQIQEVQRSMRAVPKENASEVHTTPGLGTDAVGVQARIAGVV